MNVPGKTQRARSSHANAHILATHTGAFAKAKFCALAPPAVGLLAMVCEPFGSIRVTSS